MFGFGKKVVSDQMVGMISLEIAMFESWRLENLGKGLPDNEIEYLLNAFNLQVIKDFKKYPEFFELKKGNKTELLRPAYVDDNETVFLKGIVETSEEEE